jgi:hypothetical protein
MNTAQIKKIVHKLRISDNNVVVVKKQADDKSSDNSLATELAEVIKQSNLRNVIVISVDSVDDVAILDTHMMNKVGWFRKEQLISLLGKMTAIAKPVEQVDTGSDNGDSA